MDPHEITWGDSVGKNSQTKSFKNKTSIHEKQEKENCIKGAGVLWKDIHLRRQGEFYDMAFNQRDRNS